MQTGTIRKTKCCPRCGRTLPRTAEYFHRDRYRGDGLHHRCKACVNMKEPSLPKCNEQKLWINMPCAKCGKTTEHIYCQSLEIIGKDVYACFECGKEAGRAKEEASCNV